MEQFFLQHIAHGENLYQQGNFPRLRLSPHLIFFIWGFWAAVNGGRTYEISGVR